MCAVERLKSALKIPDPVGDHNNYDVVELFYRGWPHMLPSQRREAGNHMPICCAGVFPVRRIGMESCSILTRVTRSRTNISQPRFLTPLDSSILPGSSGPPTIYLTRVQ